MTIFPVPTKEESEMYPVINYVLPDPSAYLGLRLLVYTGPVYQEVCDE